MPVFQIEFQRPNLFRPLLNWPDQRFIHLFSRNFAYDLNRLQNDLALVENNALLIENQ
jgi:hypothetical protein